MNNDDAIANLGAALAAAIDTMPADSFVIDINAARTILDNVPGNLELFYAALRDAFRDNIDCPDDDTIAPF